MFCHCFPHWKSANILLANISWSMKLSFKTISWWHHSGGFLEIKPCWRFHKPGHGVQSKSCDLPPNHPWSFCASPWGKRSGQRWSKCRVTKGVQLKGRRSLPMWSRICCMKIRKYWKFGQTFWCLVLLGSAWFMILAVEEMAEVAYSRVTGGQGRWCTKDTNAAQAFFFLHWVTFEIALRMIVLRLFSFFCPGSLLESQKTLWHGPCTSPNMHLTWRLWKTPQGIDWLDGLDLPQVTLKNHGFQVRNLRFSFGRYQSCGQNPVSLGLAFQGLQPADTLPESQKEKPF